MLARMQAGTGAVGIAALVVAVGCGPTLGVRGQLVQQAGQQNPCEHMTRVAQLSENAFEVDGCGMMVEYTDVLGGPERAFQPMVPAASLAASDTHCRLDQLVLGSDAAPMRRTFTGCGLTASYALVCVDEGGCHWDRVGTPVAATGVLVTSTVLSTTPSVPAGYGDSVSPPPPGAP